jgi:hypothetical protein
VWIFDLPTLVAGAGLNQFGCSFSVSKWDYICSNCVVEVRDNEAVGFEAIVAHWVAQFHVETVRVPDLGFGVNRQVVHVTASGVMLREVRER